MSRQRWAHVVKRGVDILGASAGLVATSPLLALSALAVRVSMGSPVLFSQERPGLNAKIFKVYKLRTMNEPRPGENRYASDGQRLTRVGSFLRSTSLDELPTLWNVLNGEMSLVGPRPLLVEYLDRYTKEQARRHEVKPGVTGLAQVRGRNAISWEERFELDVWYVDHWSLGLDLKILLETVGLVARRSGVSHGEHPTMPQFTGAPAAGS